MISKNACILCLTIALSGAGKLCAQQQIHSHGEPTNLEQYMLELINRARANPAQEGDLIAVSGHGSLQKTLDGEPDLFENFDNYPKVSPLAFEPRLIAAAREHSADMIDRNFFAHDNPDGESPTDRARRNGYDEGLCENISGGPASNASEVSQRHFGLMLSHGHRLNILRNGYTEIGVGRLLGHRRYNGIITQKIGNADRSYILGVAFFDRNGNGFYDPGEGLSGVKVSPNFGDWRAITSASGGFAIPIEPIETITDEVTIPLPVQTTEWADFKPFDDDYRAEQLEKAGKMQVVLTWSGGGLSRQMQTSFSINRPVKINYKLHGSDRWFYNRSFFVSQNVKSDLRVTTQPTPPKIKMERDGNFLILSWDTEYVLEMATSLDDSWRRVGFVWEENGVSKTEIYVDESQAFFRLR